jgi:hypothetical protein
VNLFQPGLLLVSGLAALSMARFGPRAVPLPRTCARIPGGLALAHRRATP